VVVLPLWHSNVHIVLNRISNTRVLGEVAAWDGNLFGRRPRVRQSSAELRKHRYEINAHCDITATRHDYEIEAAIVLYIQIACSQPSFHKEILNTGSIMSNIVSSESSKPTL